MTPIEKIIMALAIVLLAAITIAPFIDGLVSHQPAYAESTEGLPTPTATNAGSEANLPQVTTAQPQPTVVPTATERWSHGNPASGYDLCDQIHRTYGVYTTWRQEADGKEYCLVYEKDLYCDKDGCWLLKVPLDGSVDIDKLQL